MKITITLYCPDCQSAKIKKNGKKSYKKQNYKCKSCGRQFIGDHALSYKGCHSILTQKILQMPVRGIGIRDISVIENVSVKKVLSVPINSNRIITPKRISGMTSFTRINGIVLQLFFKQIIIFPEKKTRKELKVITVD